MSQWVDVTSEGREVGVLVDRQPYGEAYLATWYCAGIPFASTGVGVYGGKTVLDAPSTGLEWLDEAQSIELVERLQSLIRL